VVASVLMINRVAVGNLLWIIDYVGRNWRELRKLTRYRARAVSTASALARTGGFWRSVLVDRALGLGTPRRGDERRSVLRALGLLYPSCF